MKDHIILLCVLFAFLTHSTAFACTGKLISICGKRGKLLELMQEVRKKQGPISGPQMCGEYCANQNQNGPPVRQCDATEDIIGISEQEHKEKPNECLYYNCACHWAGEQKEPSPL